MILRKILLVVFLLLISSTSLASDKAISEDEIKNYINKMLIGKEYKYKIIKVSKVIHNLCIVAISPPYREFPNVIAFQFENKRWHRIFEGFTIGIQANKSDKLDLHTIGWGADVVYSDGKPIVFNDIKIKEIMTKNKCKAIIIPYDDFIHMHVSENSEEFYTIDKSNFAKYAVYLLGEKFYPKSRQECVMFDMPDIVDIEFYFKDGRFIIHGSTNNDQIWNISFDGVDIDKMFFKNKKVIVEKSRTIACHKKTQFGFNQAYEIGIH